LAEDVHTEQYLGRLMRKIRIRYFHLREEKNSRPSDKSFFSFTKNNAIRSAAYHAIANTQWVKKGNKNKIKRGSRKKIIGATKYKQQN